MWEDTSVCPRVETALASSVILTDNFHGYNEVVKTISQFHVGEGGSSDVTDRPRGVEPCDHLSVFRTLVGSILSWLEFLLVLIIGIMKSFWKLERANDSKILAVKPNNRNKQDQILGCSLIETNELGQKPSLKKLKQVFKTYVSRSEKCPSVPESAMNTSNFPQRSSENMQGCECELKQ